MLVLRQRGQSVVVEITTSNGRITATRVFDFWSDAEQYAAQASLRTGCMVQTF